MNIKQMQLNYTKFKKINMYGTLFNLLMYSEVRHRRCVFKLQGEVNSVKNTTMNIWLNDGVY